MLCKRNTFYRRNIIVAGDFDPVRGIGRRDTTNCTHGVVLPGGIVAPRHGRRLNGEARLIDLERRARFSHPMSGNP